MGGALAAIAAAVLVAGCGGSGARRGGSEASAQRSAAKTPPTYPVVWTRPLASASRLLVTGLSVEPTTGDVVIAAQLRGNAQMAGRLLTQLGENHDAVVARYDAGEGQQVWTAQIGATGSATVVALGSGPDGSIFVAVRYAGTLLAEPWNRLPADSSFVGRLDPTDGALVSALEYGASARGSVSATDTEYRMYRASDDAIDIELVASALKIALLPDGAFALRESEASGMVVRGPEPVVRWRRADIHPRSVIGVDGRYIVAGRLDGEYVVMALSPVDGETVWKTHIDVGGLVSPRMNVSSTGDGIALIVFDQRDTFVVHTLNADGAVLSVDRLARQRESAGEPDGSTYAIRGHGEDNELVKLGPCPGDFCTPGAR